MSNYNTYPDFGIDTKIKLTQNILSDKLGFTSVDFYGRVQRSLNKDSKTFIPEYFYEYPKKREVYYDGKTAKGGNVFFINDVNSKELSGGMFQSQVKVVFMLNLDFIFSQSKDYRADTEVQAACLKLLKKTGFFTDNVSISEGVEEVFKGFDVSKIKLHNMNPYHVFSINGNVNYSPTTNCN